jgi:hypothetical protein
MRGILAALVLAACVPNLKVVRGTITQVQHDASYEEPCGLRGAIYHACDDPPVCCAYWVTLRDSASKRTTFFAQWPRLAPGLWVSEEILATLRRTRIHGVCTLYGCVNETNALALQDDSDYVILKP